MFFYGATDTPLFWTCGDPSSRFQSQSRQLYSRLAEANWYCCIQLTFYTKWQLTSTIFLISCSVFSMSMSTLKENEQEANNCHGYHICLTLSVTTKQPLKGTYLLLLSYTSPWIEIDLMSSYCQNILLLPHDMISYRETLLFECKINPSIPNFLLFQLDCMNQIQFSPSLLHPSSHSPCKLHWHRFPINWVQTETCKINRS